MPYSESNYQENNIEYLNKDFKALKDRLIQYAKS